MRIAVTLEQLWHRVPGGTGWAAIELLRSLLATDTPPDLVGVAARHRRPPASEWAPPIPVAHFALPRLALYESWHAPLWRGPSVERVTGPVDVVHATAVAFPSSRAPVVVSLHDLAFLHDRQRATRHGHRFLRRGMALARDHARLVVVPSRATEAECLAAGFDASRLRHVPLGVHAQAATAETVERVRRRYGLPERYVLFCGTLEPRKNLGRLLDAFASIAGARPDVTLVIAGPEGWNEEIGPRVERLGDRARRLGFLPRPELDAAMAGAAAVCYPSLAEGFGFPVLEAMAQGAPVVTSRGTSTEEVAGDAALLVDPRDTDAIAAGLARVLDDRALRAELAARGRRRAETFSWDRTAAGYLAAYREAAS